MGEFGKKNLLTLLLAITIPLNLTGCGSKKDQDKAFSDYVKTMANIIPLYKFPEFNLTDEELDKILATADTTKECQSTETDYSNLGSLIIQNSIKYSDEYNRVFISYDDLENYGSEEVDRDLVMRLALEKAIENVFKTNSDVKEDICHLKDLVIVNANLQNEADLAYIDLDNLCYAAYFPLDNTLIVDYNALEFAYRELQAKGLVTMSYVDFVALNINHELNHARSYICSCRKEAGQKYESFNYGQTLMSVTEASAESQLYGDDLNLLKNNRALYVYGQERYQEAILLLLAAFKENRNVDQYYEALNNSDLKALYEFFGLNGREDFRQFYDIVRTMDSISNNNAKGAFLDSNGYTESNAKEKVLGYTYKLNIFKEALNDLVEYQNKNGDLSFKECIFLYNFIKSYIITSTYEVVGENPICIVYDEEFTQYFLEIEKAFYQYLENYFGVSDKKIESETKNVDDFFQELNDGDGKIAGKLNTKFPLIRFIYVTIPLRINALGDYNEDTLWRMVFCDSMTEGKSLAVLSRK